MTIHSTFMYPGEQAKLISDGRAAQAKRRTEKFLIRLLKPIHDWHFDEQHRTGRALQEAALRNGTARGLPSVFGDQS